MSVCPPLFGLFQCSGHSQELITHSTGSSGEKVDCTGRWTTIEEFLNAFMSLSYPVFVFFSDESGCMVPNHLIFYQNWLVFSNYDYFSVNF